MSKEVIYKTHFSRELLVSGECLGYKYWIMNFGTHPVAYVEIPKNHKLYGERRYSIDIDVHGGITYTSPELYIAPYEEIKDSWFIGWDYGHAGDYLGWFAEFGYYTPEYKKWTTKEIQQDVFNVCKQLKELEKVEDK